MMLVPKKASNLNTTSKAEWLLEGVIPERSLCFLGAAPKAGKTMMALEIATSLCANVKAFGMHVPTRKARVVYFAGEDSEAGINSRLQGFAKSKGLNILDLDLFIITEQTLLIDQPEGRTSLETMLKDLNPDLLILDNLSRIHRSNENNATAMGHLFEYLQSIKIKFNLSILLVAHLGKDGTLRGSSQIDSYYEAAMFLKTNGNTRTCTFKFRNYEERENVPYKIDSSNGISVTFQAQNNETVEVRIGTLPNGEKYRYFVVNQ